MQVASLARNMRDLFLYYHINFTWFTNNRTHAKEEIESLRWSCGVKHLTWISGSFDLASVFAQTFGIVGIVGKDNKLDSTDSTLSTKQTVHQIKNVDRRDGNQLSKLEFDQDYSIPGRPLLLTSIASQWPLMNLTLEVCKARTCWWSFTLIS